MKKLLALFFVLTLLAAGCTQNNGHIGPVFGSWALDGITENGDPLELQDETVFSFQNEVVQVIRIHSSFEIEARYGNFSIEGDIMQFKFLTELPSEGQGVRFLMPSWLYFPEGEMPLRFDVRKLDGSRMILALEHDGKVYVYTFSRTW
ncbi:MAG: lipocalin-like domain-containing protein [Muribaculaceae bacterium]|nr:lipocalin-like domain-containing protein [Muribaculaceae bacterium]